MLLTLCLIPSANLSAWHTVGTHWALLKWTFLWSVNNDGISQLSPELPSTKKVPCHSEIVWGVFRFHESSSI